MKVSFLLCCLLMTASLLTEGATAAIPLQQTPANVQIVNGKKFISLTSARRFNGGLNSPKAMNIMHHPRAATPAAGNHLLPVATPSANGGKPMAKNSSDQILSIFSPDNKSTQTPIPPVPAR